MKNLLLLALVLANVLFAHSSTRQTKTDENLLKKVTTQNFSQREIPLDQYTTLLRVKENIDKKGNEHIKYQSTCNGVPIENHFLIAHKIGDRLSWSSRIIPDMNINPNPSLSEQAAIQIAIAAANVKYPVWEIEASSKPKGKLLIYDSNYSYVAAQYRLAYKFEVFSVRPLSHKIIYVDANTGIVLGNKENTHNCAETCNSKQVSGPTNYIGEVDFEVCCDDNGCYVESDKGGKIIIYDAKESWDSQQNCVIDNFEDPTVNEVYFATHLYYDFLLDAFDRKSIDDEDHALIAFVHYGEQHNNAYWFRGASYFGDGDGEYANSYTSIDIIAHEYTHGLNDYTANLIYEGESGALDESFADIFGLMLENYLFGETDWQIGNDFMIQYSAMRSFTNPVDPTLKRKYPDTYQGDNWRTIEENCGDNNDNCWVHTNSSVQNYWFYLLSEGGSGVNDNGYAYDIEGIGIENAGQIVYQNLTNYLFPTATFMDAREGAIEAAKNIFGEDSFEAKQTELAWCAVGVGECEFINPSCRETDSLALIALYNATDGPNWKIPWDLSQPMSTWYGVLLNDDGCVTHIDLDGEVNWTWSENEFGGNNLIGTIPDELGDLNFLHQLNLANNQLSGNIPKELGGLSNLYIFDLHSNQLTGNIPAELGNLKKLGWLLLYDNQLSESIPFQLGNLSNLVHLSLINNQLSGNIPPQLGNLTNLVLLGLNSNKLTGKIPPELGNLSKLTSLYLCCNKLNGSIPLNLGSLHLNDLDLSNNQLSGSIPAELSNLSNLIHLALNSNQLSGNISPELGNLNNMVYLNLSFNQLSGCYNDNLKNFCTQLTGEFWGYYSNISEGNNFDATWEEFCATSAGSCESEIICNTTDDSVAMQTIAAALNIADWTAEKELKDWPGVRVNEEGRVTEIRIDSDMASDNIPAEFGDLCYLESLRIFYDDDISASIPPQLGNLQNLKQLIIHGIIGNIPDELYNCLNLEVLELYGIMSGTISPKIDQLSKLKILRFNAGYDNRNLTNLTGEIPAEIGNLVNLIELSFSYQTFSGGIPSTFSNLVNLKILHLRDNHLSGNINWLGDLISLEEVDILDNQFSGSIPSSIGNLHNIKHLGLASNNLSGEIPVELCNCTTLEGIGFSNNGLTGSIPSCIGQLVNLEYLNLGGNSFEGEIPEELFNLINLKELDIFSNQLSGYLSPLFNKLTNLEILKLGRNNFKGEIPAELGYLGLLKQLWLYSNNLTGTIPASFAKLDSLESFYINDNNLSSCFAPELQALCRIDFNVPGWPVYGHAVDKGNDFDAPWEDFCTTQAGICKDDFVLPGDFNADGCLSYLDVLFWGLAEGNKGLARTMPTNNYVQQIAEDWEVIVNGVNGKHQDANGDGIVNIDDLYVFIDNYTAKENRCDSNGANRNNDYLNFARIVRQNTVAINETTKEVTYEVYIDSKVDNMKVGLHGLELELNFIGKAIKKVDLDVSSFDAKVDTVTSFEGSTYRFAATRTDKGLSIYGRDDVAAILVVTVEDLPGGATREKEEIVSTGSIMFTGSGIEELSALQGAHTFIVTDNEVEEESYSVDIVTSPHKGEVKVFVNLKDEVVQYTYELAPGAEEPCEGTFSEEKIGCNEVQISDGCNFSETIKLDVCDDVPTPTINDLQIFPNLVYDKFIVTPSTEYCGRQIDKIEIYNVAGNAVQSAQTNKSDCSYQVNVGELPGGIYFINMFTGDVVLTGKFIKQ